MRRLICRAFLSGDLEVKAAELHGLNWRSREFSSSNVMSHGASTRVASGSLFCFAFRL